MGINRLQKTATFFALLFVIIVSAPTVIMSIDDSIDVTLFYGENEEEEKENLKLLFDVISLDSESQDISKTTTDSDVYTFKKYSKPNLNLIFPPPDYI
ncbi:hypothetical protein BTO05_09595 [Winogradskyella sp. PC-19]|nr:hypothetical protein BTO05_09595 [Winogradskyella sp. PC-19]RZN84461.1 MAG: hypothetical protein EVB12_00020 [Winogradskyella sp.]